MKIDLHVHTSERSGCATVNEENQIRAAIHKGLDGIAITDHDLLVPRARLLALNEKFAPFKVFTGIEVSADDLHWVVIGIHDPVLESLNWHYPDLQAFVRSRGGFIFLAHPFRYKPTLQVDLDAFPSDGIEVESINTPSGRKDNIVALARRLGLVQIRNSDGHHVDGVGKFHNLLPRLARDDRELVAVLMSMKNHSKPA
jgi:hypothetical protein